MVTLPIDRIDCLSKLRINLSKVCDPLVGFCTPATQFPSISSTLHRATAESQDLKSADNRQAGMRLVGEVFRRFKGEIPVLEPEQELKVDKSMYRKVRTRAVSRESTRCSFLHGCIACLKCDTVEFVR